MKKTYLLDEIDCPNCAAKLEDAVSKIQGVKAAAVNFFAQKLIVEADDEKVFEAAVATVRKMFPDCEVK